VSAGERRNPSRGVISRDTFSFLGGWYLIIYQAQFAQTFNLSVFIGGVLIACVPGSLAAWATRAGGVPPIEPPSSGSQPGVSQGPLSS
jgi:hypothetical protein